MPLVDAASLASPTPVHAEPQAGTASEQPHPRPSAQALVRLGPGKPAPELHRGHTPVVRRQARRQTGQALRWLACESSFLLGMQLHGLTLAVQCQGSQPRLSRWPSTLAGKNRTARNSAKRASKVMPTSRNGSESSHTSGQSKRASSANGQHRTNRMHQRMSRIIRCEP